MDKSISSTEIKKMLDGKVSLYPYEALVKFDNIDDVFGNNDCLVILYETADHYGHWTGLIRRGDEIEFFDSYGLSPDKELAFVPQNFRVEFHEEHPHLTYLLKGSGVPYIHNPFQLQSKKRNINTCGRHVACRLACKDMDITDYVKMIEDIGQNPDEVVTAITDKILG